MLAIIGCISIVVGMVCITIMIIVIIIIMCISIIVFIIIACMMFDSSNCTIIITVRYYNNDMQ